MRHRMSGRGLGRKSSHRQALIRNQITELLRHDRIVTTEAKAKSVRPAAEKVITLGKRGTLHARRQAGAVLTDKDVLRRLFDDIAPRFETRPGGYTRITKLGPRRGDGARMAMIELVGGPVRAAAAAVATETPAEAAAAPPAAEAELAEADAPETDAADETLAAEAEAEAAEPAEAASEDDAPEQDAAEASAEDDDSGDADDESAADEANEEEES